MFVLKITKHGCACGKKGKLISISSTVASGTRNSIRYVVSSVGRWTVLLIKRAETEKKDEQCVPLNPRRLKRC